MLGIALYKNKINYIRSERSKQGLVITNHGTIKYDSFNDIINSSIKDVLAKEKIEKEKNISFFIDSQFCVYNEIFCEDDKNLDFHNNLSGSQSLSDNLDSYYYPINSRDDHFLGIHINKGIKQRLLNTAETFGCDVQVIGIGIFSSEVLARFLFGAKSLDNYLILRFIAANKLEALYIDDGILNVYTQCKVVGKDIRGTRMIGNPENLKKVLNCIKKIVINGNSKFSKIEKIFLYQTHGQSNTIKNIVKSNNKSGNIKLLNIFDYNSTPQNGLSIRESMEQISYAELGQIFGGLNV